MDEWTCIWFLRVQLNIRNDGPELFQGDTSRSEDFPDILKMEDRWNYFRLRSTTVDSKPTSQSPPSMIQGHLPWRSWNTCAAVVGLGRPLIRYNSKKEPKNLKLAEGAAIGSPLSSISFLAMGWDGIRMATVGWPQETLEVSKELK